MEVNDELRELILVGASALELKKKAIEQGNDHASAEAGLIKVAAGTDDYGRSSCAKRSYRTEGE